jgi:cation transport regulator ChaC
MTVDNEHELDARVWYFAYGSNLHRSIFIERRKMDPLATRWGWLNGYGLHFNIPIGPGERGVANIEPEAAARTCGALYLLSTEQFEYLDRIEGVNFGIYRRLAVEVLTEAGERIAAFAYQSAVTTSGRKPSLRYMGLLREGARQHGLPSVWMEFLESFELAVDEREHE